MRQPLLVLILSAVLCLAGAGCTNKTPKESPVPNAKNDQPNVILQSESGVNLEVLDLKVSPANAAE